MEALYNLEEGLDSDYEKGSLAEIDVAMAHTLHTQIL